MFYQSFISNRNLARVGVTWFPTSILSCFISSSLSVVPMHLNSCESWSTLLSWSVSMLDKFGKFRLEEEDRRLILWMKQITYWIRWNLRNKYIHNQKYTRIIQLFTNNKQYLNKYGPAVKAESGQCIMSRFCLQFYYPSRSMIEAFISDVIEPLILQTILIKPNWLRLFYIIIYWWL